MANCQLDSPVLSLMENIPFSARRKFVVPTSLRDWTNAVGPCLSTVPGLSPTKVEIIFFRMNSLAL